MRVFLEFASFRSFPISVEAPKEGKFKESCMDISSLQLPSHIYIPCVRCKEVARNVDHLHPQISATCPVLALACHVFASPPPPLSQFGSVHLLHPRVSPNRRHLALLPPLPLILHAAGFGDGQTLSHLIRKIYIRRHYLYICTFPTFYHILRAVGDQDPHSAQDIKFSHDFKQFHTNLCPAVEAVELTTG